ARHHPAGVQEDEHALLALGLVLDADRPAAPRGGRPRDRPRIVVRTVFAEPLEDAPGTRQPRAPLAGVVRQPTAQADLVPADLAQVRVDVRRRVGGDVALALHEIERT